MADGMMDEAPTGPVKYLRCSLMLVFALNSAAILTSLASLFIPTWITARNPLTGEAIYHFGPLSYCFYPPEGIEMYADMSKSCKWFESMEDSDTPNWLLACIILTACGCSLLLITNVFSLLMCRKNFTKNPECSTFISIGAFFSFAAFLANLILFGVKSAKEFQAKFVDRNANSFFNWGYYICIIGCGFSFLGLLILVVAVNLAVRAHRSSEYDKTYSYTDAHREVELDHMYRK